MLFHHTGQFENKLDCKLKKQEIVFDTAVFHYELTYTNNGWLEFKKAMEERYKQKVLYDFLELTNCTLCRKDTSMPIRAGVFFDMFPFCVVFEVRIFILFSLFFTAPRDKHRIKLDRGRQGQALNSDLELIIHVLSNLLLFHKINHTHS